MANENFKIVSGASIYNIRNIFNTFIEALSESGVANIIANPEMTETFFDSNQQSVVAGWDVDGVINTTGRYVILNTGEAFRQDIADMVHLGDVYTLSVTLNNQKAGRLRVWNNETLINPNDKRVYEWDPGIGIGGNLPEISVPAAPIDATSGQQYNQTVQIPFILHETLKSGRLYIEFISDEDSNKITVETVSCVKGIFAFSDARGEALFTHSVRYRSDAGQGWWEVTYDNADTWHRLLTASEEDVARITADLTTSFYTKTETDAKYLKRAGDTATGLIDLDQGALVGNRFEVKNGVTPKFKNKDVVFNGGDVGTSRFTLYVYSANAANPLLTYVPGFGWHYQNEDGVLRPFGSGGGGGGTGDANSEAEFYAEILQHCGYKYVAFDSFSFADTVFYTPNVKYDSDLGAFYIDPTGGGTQAVITKNLFDATNIFELTDYREWFVVPLTDRTNNEGINCFYSFTTDVPGSNPTINHGGWTAFDYTQEQLSSTAIDEIYFKFEWADESVKFYSYGYFYGNWPFDDIGPNLAMQQVDQPASDISIGTPVTLPNGATYAIGENSLEIYVNRAKMVEGIDYNEINESQVSFTFPIYAGDIIEYIERYTYIDVSQDNSVILQNHINDDSIHGLDETTFSQFLVHLDSTNAHGFDLADFATKAEVAQNAADSTDFVERHIDDKWIHGGPNIIHNQQFGLVNRAHRLDGSGGILFDSSRTINSIAPTYFFDRWHTQWESGTTSGTAVVSRGIGSTETDAMANRFSWLDVDVQSVVGSGWILAKQIIYAQLPTMSYDWALSFDIKGPAGVSITADLGDVPFAPAHVLTGGWDHVEMTLSISPTDQFQTKKYGDAAWVPRTAAQWIADTAANQNQPNTILSIGRNITNTGVYSITNVKLEPGLKHTHIMSGHSENVWDICTKYWQKVYHSESLFGTNAVGVATNEMTISFPETMVISPTVSFVPYAFGGGSNLISPASVVGSTNNQFTYQFNSGGGDTIVYGWATLDSELY